MNRHKKCFHRLFQEGKLVRHSVVNTINLLLAVFDQSSNYLKCCIKES